MDEILHIQVCNSSPKEVMTEDPNAPHGQFSYPVQQAPGQPPTPIKMPSLSFRSFQKLPDNAKGLSVLGLATVLTPVFIFFWIGDVFFDSGPKSIWVMAFNILLLGLSLTSLWFSAKSSRKAEAPGLGLGVCILAVLMTMFLSLFVYAYLSSS